LIALAWMGYKGHTTLGRGCIDVVFQVMLHQ